ncbi:MAG: hypothetical protein IKJ31_08630, partial [Bacteroidaceae bacterium]|nr:hypothetical protein [Bacteroidaceae bacterium]
MRKITLLFSLLLLFTVSAMAQTITYKAGARKNTFATGDKVFVYSTCMVGSNTSRCGLIYDNNGSAAFATSVPNATFSTTNGGYVWTVENLGVDDNGYTKVAFKTAEGNYWGIGGVTTNGACTENQTFYLRPYTSATWGGDGVTVIAGVGGTWCGGDVLGQTESFTSVAPANMTDEHKLYAVVAGNGKSLNTDGGRYNGSANGAYPIAFYEVVEEEYVTTADDFNNNKIYTFITSRGWLLAEDGQTNVASTYLQANSSLSTGDNVANCQWAVYRSESNKYYMYNIGAGKFIGYVTGNGNAIPFVESPNTNVIFKETTKNGYPLMFSSNNGEGACNHADKAGANGFITWSTTAAGKGWNSLNDDGSSHKVQVVGTIDDTTLETIAGLVKEYEDDIAEAKVAALAVVEGKDGLVGYPVASELEAFRSIVNAENVRVEEIEAAKASLYASTNVNMPEDGKAYTFVNVQKDGTTFYLKYENTGITLSSNSADAEVFVCRKTDNDKYVFVNNSGKYFAHKGAGTSSYSGVNSNKGYTDSYDQTADKYLNDFGIVKLTPSGVATTNNTDAIAVTNELLFGYVGLYTRRHDRNEDVYYIFKKSNGFDQANAPFCRHDLTSMVLIKPAEYANTPVLNNVTDQTLINIDGSMATFSAPFATVVPEGVTAYTATDNGN